MKKVIFSCLKLLKISHYIHRINVKGEYYDW